MSTFKFKKCSLVVERDVVDNVVGGETRRYFDNRVNVGYY